MYSHEGDLEINQKFLELKTHQIDRQTVLVVKLLLRQENFYHKKMYQKGVAAALSLSCPRPGESMKELYKEVKINNLS